jgi:hypothetical protein
MASSGLPIIVTSPVMTIRESLLTLATAVTGIRRSVTA